MWEAAGDRLGGHRREGSVQPRSRHTFPSGISSPPASCAGPHTKCAEGGPYSDGAPKGPGHPPELQHVAQPGACLPHTYSRVAVGGGECSTGKGPQGRALRAGPGQEGTLQSMPVSDCTSAPQLPARPHLGARAGNWGSPWLLCLHHYGLNCVPPKSMLRPTPTLLFGDGTFKEVVKVK